jgi:hypothetical protein
VWLVSVCLAINYYKLWIGFNKPKIDEFSKVIMDPVWYADKVELTFNTTLSNITKNSTRTLRPLEALRPTLQWVLICLYSATAIISFCSHITVILVLYYGKKSSRELKKYLINLSLSDVCMSLCSIPFTYTDFMLGKSFLFD